MRKEAVSSLPFEPTKSVYSYEFAETTQDVAAMMQLVVTTRTEQVAVVAIHLDFEREGRSVFDHLSQANQSTRYFLDNLRTLVRKTDIVFLAQHTFYFILLGANLQGGNIVQERLWEALLWRAHNTSEGEMLRPRSMAIGHSAYPESYDDVHQCILAAREASIRFDLHPEKRKGKPTPVQQSADNELSALARKLGIPYLALLPRKLPAKVLHLVRPQLVQELRCYPLGRTHDTLTVAIADPQNSQALERLQHETGLQIFPVLVPPQEIEIVLEQLLLTPAL
jgi:hypothetical protein